MRTRVGLAIACDSLRAVMVRRGAIVWAGHSERDPAVSLAEAIAALLARAPLPRRRRLVVTVAVGPHASQVKLLEGLPPVENTAVLAAIVRERPSTFFLQDTPLCVTGVRLAGPGRVWAAAVGAPTVEAVALACSRPGLRLAAIAPLGVVLPRAFDAAQISYTDGSTTLEIEAAGSVTASVRRLPRQNGDHAAKPIVVPALAAMGERAIQFADAYAAAILPIGESLTLGRAGDVPWDRRRLRARVLPPSLLGLASASVLLLSPLMPLVATWYSEAALRGIQASDEWRLAVQVESQVQRADDVLAEIERFARSRPVRSRLLAELARALPDSTAVERLDARRDELTVVITSRDVTSATAAVRTVPGVASITVTREAAAMDAAGSTLERATLLVRYDGVVPGQASAEAERR